jgi:TetR/AcrR family tetracycline transcriptional repressor
LNAVKDGLNGVKLSSVPRKGPEQPLERDRVVRAALELLDQVGLDGLTLRKLAAELGVQAPALYWHFASKRELLDHMAHVIAEGASVIDLDDRPWDEGLADYARSRRRALLAHRDGARVTIGNRPVGGMFPVFEAALAQLVKAGFTPVEGLRSMVAISTFVAGFVVEEQAEQYRNAEEGWTEEQDQAAFRALLAERSYPTMVEALRVGGDPNGVDTFEFGLRLLIEGMRAVLASRP